MYYVIQTNGKWNNADHAVAIPKAEGGVTPTVTYFSALVPTQPSAVTYIISAWTSHLATRDLSKPQGYSHRIRAMALIAPT